MKHRRLVQGCGLTVAGLALAYVLIWACLPMIAPNGPCAVPRRVTEADVVGEWRAVYSNYYVKNPITNTLVVSETAIYRMLPDGALFDLGQCGSAAEPAVDYSVRCPVLQGEEVRITGEEQVVINRDGTYRQTFSSGSYTFTGPLNTWHLIIDPAAGPMLQMDGMKYFAAGIVLADSPIHLSLGAQMADQLRAQDYYQKHPVEQTTTSGITHRDTGFVYPDIGFVYLFPRLCTGKLSLLQMVFGGGDPDNLTVRNPIFTRVAR
ncbi:MAG: hypothetical protein FJ011_19445 [Chloroflexi bacterium]|nr:hypothetical protein [Chloroflexota bacterium]